MNKTTLPVALQINSLVKTYHNGVKALKGVSFEVCKGDFFALLGPNGAGKSTLISILTSIVNKTSGSVRIFDLDIDRQFEQAKACIGVVPQEFNFNMFEKVDNILFGQAGYYGISRRQAKPRIEKYLRQLELWDKRTSIARALSGGMKRRLMIARALVHEPKMLILDEPTAGVDIEIRRSMWRFLRELNQQGVTIILTTHYLEEAENLCKNIAIIDHGEIIENTSMAALLQKLDREAFILYLAKPCEHLPVISGFEMHLQDPYTLEVLVPKQLGISELFEQLQKHGIVVSSLRNKVNRLEELFVRLTNQE